MHAVRAERRVVGRPRPRGRGPSSAWPPARRCRTSARSRSGTSSSGCASTASGCRAAKSEMIAPRPCAVTSARPSVGEDGRGLVQLVHGHQAGDGPRAVRRARGRGVRRGRRSPGPARRRRLRRPGGAGSPRPSGDGSGTAPGPRLRPTDPAPNSCSGGSRLTSRPVVSRTERISSARGVVGEVAGGGRAHDLLAGQAQQQVALARLERGEHLGGDLVGHRRAARRRTDGRPRRGPGRWRSRARSGRRAAHQPWARSMTALSTSGSSVRACSMTSVADSAGSMRSSSPRRMVKWPSSSGTSLVSGRSHRESSSSRMSSGASLSRVSIMRSVDGGSCVGVVDDDQSRERRRLAARCGALTRAGPPAARASRCGRRAPRWCRPWTARCAAATR